MNLTKNFTLEELTQSSTAKRYGIDNMPNKGELDSLTELCEAILQPIRDKYGSTIIVSSGFRCPQLNKLVKGSPTSQHVKGEAADIHTVSDTVEDNKRLFQLIKEMIDSGEITVGQLINEYNYNWIHVSLPSTKHNNQILSIK